MCESLRGEIREYAYLVSDLIFADLKYKFKFHTNNISNSYVLFSGIVTVLYIQAVTCYLYPTLICEKNPTYKTGTPCAQSNATRVTSGYE